MKSKAKTFLIKQCKIMVAIFLATLICSVSVSLIKTADASSKAASNANDDALRQAFAFAADVSYEYLNAKDMVATVFDRYKMLGKVKEVSGELGRIQETITIIAMGLVFVYFGIMIIRESMRGDPSMEYWFKILAMLLVSVAVLSNQPTIMGAVDDLGEYVINEVSDYHDKNKDKKISAEDARDLHEQAMLMPYELLADNDLIVGLDKMLADEKTRKEMITATETYLGIGTKKNGKKNTPGDTTRASKVIGKGSNAKNTDWSKLLMLQIQLTLITFLRIGFIIAIDAQIFFIFMQLLLRGLMMPIALAGIVSEGTRGPGLRYLKRYFALYLQMAIILIIAMSFTNILDKMMAFANEIHLNSIVTLYFMMSCMGAMIAAVSQSSSIANELVGD